MSSSSLTALSAVDGRYQRHTAPLAAHFSEAALIGWRLRVEVAWLEKILPLLAPDLRTHTTASALTAIKQEIGNNADTAAADIKRIEQDTKHDVKAVEYWLAARLQAHNAAALRPYVHFACTSWDINNVAFSKQVSAAVCEVMLPQLRDLTVTLQARAAKHAAVPMLSRTHGQAASPTTVGKEFANFVARLMPRLQRLETLRLPAKFNGAVGNYNAHLAAAPTFDWQQIAREFIESWGLRFAPHTTQIEPYDDLADLFDLVRRINGILLDLCRDCWGYIGIDYFLQQSAGGAETGSSTMPHKINPIDFENAEGNIGVANALLSHFADKLQVSRWQRDLSDSTVLRAVGGAFGHTLIAWRATATGLGKISLNHEKLAADLDANWQVLGEAVQTVLRAAGVADAYEQLKALSRGRRVDADGMREFIQSLDIADDARASLLALTPATYCGLAASLARQTAAAEEEK